MNDNDKVIVCDQCLTAACWHYEFTCQKYVGAGLTVKTVGELRKLSLEHEDNWSDEKMIKIYGNADRDFPENP